MTFDAQHYSNITSSRWRIGNLTSIKVDSLTLAFSTSVATSFDLVRLLSNRHSFMLLPIPSISTGKLTCQLRRVNQFRHLHVPPVMSTCPLITSVCALIVSRLTSVKS